METLRLPWTELSYKARERRTRCAWHGWGPGATQRRKSRCVGNVAGEGRAQEHQVGLCGTAQRSGEAVTALTWFIDAQDRASTDARTDTEYFPPPPPLLKEWVVKRVGPGRFLYKSRLLVPEAPARLLCTRSTPPFKSQAKIARFRRGRILVERTQPQSTGGTFLGSRTRL